jgi:hypothetical protein
MWCHNRLHFADFNEMSTSYLLTYMYVGACDNIIPYSPYSVTPQGLTYSILILLLTYMQQLSLGDHTLDTLLALLTLINQLIFYICNVN